VNAIVRFPHGAAGKFRYQDECSAELLMVPSIVPPLEATNAAPIEQHRHGPPVKDVALRPNDGSRLPTGPACDVPAFRAVRGLHVLVVDDSAINRDIASAYLRAAGCRVDCVEGGVEAIAAVADIDFDVVLMDLRMPGMDGLEAMRRIRGLDVRGLVPIVAVTAQVFNEQMKACRELGVVGHVSKPFEPKTLLAVVRHAAAAGHRRDEAITPLFGSVSAAVTPDPVGSELPVLDPIAFAHTMSFLAPRAVGSYLQTITARGEAILSTLRGSQALTCNRNELARAAHTLAGSVSLFGFERLAAVGIRFERAVQCGAAELPAAADGLIAAIEATLQEIRARMPQPVVA
jgi:CheY-like chemotaxis protein/HPt (histidine-containing phosphotransfer) domain-containing protein